MIILKNGLATNLSESSFAVRDLGFGDRNIRNPMQQFVLVMDKSDFEAVMRPHYDDWISDQKENRGSSDSNEPAYLEKLGYPSLSEFIKHPTEFNDLFTRFLAPDLLYAVLRGAGDTGKFDFVINSVERVEARENSINISINAYPRSK